MMMMKAMALDTTGKARLVEAPRPQPQSDSDLLIQVVAAALDTGAPAVVDKTTDGGFIHAKTDPLILGWHFSGIVQQVGRTTAAKEKKTSVSADEAVNMFTVGDSVFGHLQYEPQQKQGSFAEYIVVDKQSCALKPESVSWEIAAACTTETMTAVQSLVNLGGLDKANPENNQDKSLLLLGAGGGVGYAALQIARILRVGSITAVCSTPDVDVVQQAGAHQVWDRKVKGQEDPFALAVQKGHKYDVVFDTPAKHSAWQALEVLSHQGGTYVVTLLRLNFVWAYLNTLLTFSNKKIRFISCRSVKDDLELVGRWIANGQLNIPIDSTFSIAKLEEAYQRQLDSSKKGRVVVTVRDGWD